MSRFKDLKVRAIRRELNSRVDTLEKRAAYGEYIKKNSLSLKEDTPKDEEGEKLCEVNMVDVLDESEEEC